MVTFREGKSWAHSLQHFKWWSKRSHRAGNYCSPWRMLKILVQQSLIWECDVPPPGRGPTNLCINAAEINHRSVGGGITCSALSVSNLSIVILLITWQKSKILLYPNTIKFCLLTCFIMCKQVNVDSKFEQQIMKMKRKLTNTHTCYLTVVSSEIFLMQLSQI